MSAKVLSFVIFCLAASMILPGAVGHPASTTYTSSLGAGVGTVFTASYVAASTGGAVLTAPGGHAHVGVIVGVVDTVFLHETAIVVCAGDRGPSATVTNTSPGCGGVSCGFGGIATTNAKVTVFVLAGYLDPISLHTCFGTDGDVVGDFLHP